MVHYKKKDGKLYHAKMKDGHIEITSCEECKRYPDLQAIIKGPYGQKIEDISCFTCIRFNDHLVDKFEPIT